MPRSDSAALNRRRLRSELRRLRTKADETQKAVADALFWSPSKLMRIEGGQVGVTPTDVMALLSHYGVDEKERAAIVDMARKSRGSTLSSKYGDALTPAFREFMDQEEAAIVIRQYETKWIPGLLQTPAYAEIAIMNAMRDPNLSVVAKRVEARLERQRLLLQNDGPEAFFIIDEAALWRRVGAESNAEGLMIKQLERLKELGQHRNVHIQFMPFEKGAYHSLLGPFVILEFDASDDAVLYLENPNGQSLIRDDPGQISPYLDDFTQMENAATPVEDLERYVDSVISQLSEGPVGLARV